MPLQIILGTQWGDEGKGRVVDLFSSRAELVARYNGGDNAGHTVTVGEQTFKLHLIPSGIVHPHTLGILGGGMVVNPLTFFAELDSLRTFDVAAGPERLKISHAAHLITPAHKALDAAQEASRGSDKIGTTGRGIGPAYTDKASRQGLRAGDLLDEAAFLEKLHAHIRAANRVLDRLFQAPVLDVERVSAEYASAALRLRPFLADTGLLVHRALAEGRTVLAEGAQGTLLDLDLGTYPFVTSSATTSGGVFSGLGLGARPVEAVIGVTKAFQTRVGSGPFPTELDGEMAERLRGTGSNPWDEFGTTTGRPRRVGWLDLVLLRYAARVNGLTGLVITKLDVLSGLPELRLCYAYQRGGERWEELPYGPADLDGYAAEYEDLPGWSEDLTGIRRWAELPAAALRYLERIEAAVGVPVRMVSVGPERSQIVER